MGIEHEKDSDDEASVHDLNHEGTEDDEDKKEDDVPTSFPNVSSTDPTPMNRRRTLRDAAGKVRIIQGWKKVLNTRQNLPAPGPHLHLLYIPLSIFAYSSNIFIASFARMDSILAEGTSKKVKFFLSSSSLSDRAPAMKLTCSTLQP